MKFLFLIIIILIAIVFIKKIKNPTENDSKETSIFESTTNNPLEESLISRMYNPTYPEYWMFGPGSQDNNF